MTCAVAQIYCYKKKCLGSYSLPDWHFGPTWPRQATAKFSQQWHMRLAQSSKLFYVDRRLFVQTDCNINVLSHSTFGIYRLT